MIPVDSRKDHWQTKLLLFDESSLDPLVELLGRLDMLECGYPHHRARLELWMISLTKKWPPRETQAALVPDHLILSSQTLLDCTLEVKTAPVSELAVIRCWSHIKWSASVCMFSFVTKKMRLSCLLIIISVHWQLLTLHFVYCLTVATVVIEED